jgi:hypothetical protein
MAFMQLVAEKMTVYCVETDAGTYNVPEDVLSGDDFDARGRVRRDRIVRYTEGSQVYSVRKRKGWFAHLSAPGYMDQGPWDGPYKTERKALDAVKQVYEVDDYLEEDQ